MPAEPDVPHRPRTGRFGSAAAVTLRPEHGEAFERDGFLRLGSVLTGHELVDLRARLTSLVERLDVEPDVVARVIVNERSGTVVLGGNVRLSEVAVAHGSLSVRIDTDFQTSQPRPFGEGRTTVTTDTTLDVQDGQSALRLISPEPSIEDVVAALNAVGTSPRDLIAVLEAIKSAGALHADLIIQ